MKLFYQNMAIFFNFSPTSTRLHPLQVENCYSNSRLVVDGDDNGKFRIERVGPDIKTKFPISYLEHACPKKDVQEFHFISHLTGKYATQKF